LKRGFLPGEIVDAQALIPESWAKEIPTIVEPAAAKNSRRFCDMPFSFLELVKQFLPTVSLCHSLGDVSNMSHHSGDSLANLLVRRIEKT